MLRTVSLIEEKLSNHNIIWGIGGSLLLKFYEIINKPNDIDILVNEAHTTKFNEIISSVGTQKESLRSDPFRTANFSKYKIKGIDIDVMAGFAIQHDKGIYKLDLQAESITANRKVHGIDIPLCSLEDWYVLYWLIPNKQDKALLIENYFKTNGITHPQLLEEALKQPLPNEVKLRVEKLLIRAKMKR